MRKKLIFPALALLASCTEADLFEPPAPPPLPTTGVVRLGVTPQGIAGLTCALDADGVKSAITPGTLKAFAGSSYYSSFCSAPLYEEAKGELFYLRAGDTVATNLTMVRKPVVLPPDTTTIRVEVTNVTTARVDSIFRYHPDGRRTTIASGSTPVPLTMRFGVDGSSFVFWVSAPGYATKAVEWTPASSQVKTLLVELTPIPVVTSNKGILGVASVPSRMRARVYKYGTSTIVADAMTNYERELDEGLYTIVCEDPSGKYLVDTAYVAVNAGDFQVKTCLLPKVPDAPAPPPPNTGEILVASFPTGMSVRVTKFGSGSVVGNGTTDFTRTLESGFYVVICEDPTGKYATTAVVVAVNAGQRSTAFCLMSEKLLPPPPPPPPSPILRPDTVRLGSWNFTVNRENPRVRLEREHTDIALAGVHQGPVQIRVFVRYTGKDDSFAIRFRNGNDGAWAGYAKKPNASSPVVSDQPGLSGWYWVDVGVFDWPSGQAFGVYLEHGSLFGIEPIGGWGDILIEGIEFIRWIPSA